MVPKADRKPDWTTGIPLCDPKCPCVSGVGPGGGTFGGICWPSDGDLNGRVRWGLPCHLEVHAIVTELNRLRTENGSLGRIEPEEDT